MRMRKDESFIARRQPHIWQQPTPTRSATFHRSRGVIAALGSAVQTKTPTDCCANIFRVAPICPCTVRPSSVPSQGSSMKGRERPCSIRRRLRSSQNVLQRSVELAAQSGRSLLTTDKNVASAYRFAIKAGIGRCLRFCETDSPREGLLLYLAGGAFLFGNNYHAIENARDIFGIFFQMPPEMVD